MHFPHTASVLMVSVFWSFMLECVGASLLHARPYGTSTQNGDRKFLGSPINDRAPANQRDSIIGKRGDDFGLVLASFEPQALLLPIQGVAEALEALYTTIAINAHGPWADISPRIWIRMTFGTFALLMTATEGSTVPWDFVAWFARQMLRHTERGYTGLYTASFVNPAAGSAIWVSLYHCSIGPLTDLSRMGSTANVASCLNANAQSWFPTHGRPTR